jgi:CheY-like chemotaxis protein
MASPPEAILLHRDGVVISVDDETAAMFGYLSTEMIGMPLADLLDGQATRTDEGAEPCRHQAIGIRKDGSRFLLDMMSGCSCGAKRTQQADGPTRILVVEDDPDTLHTVSRILSMKGYQVHGAPDMTTALKIAHDAEFDLLLSDICLPDGTGWDLLTQLRGAARPIRAIAMSALDGREDLQRSQTAGFAEHLVKPFQTEQLDRALRSTLEQSSK